MLAAGAGGAFRDSAGTAAALAAAFTAAARGRVGTSAIATPCGGADGRRLLRGGAARRDGGALRRRLRVCRAGARASASHGSPAMPGAPGVRHASRNGRLMAGAARCASRCAICTPAGRLRVGRRRPAAVAPVVPPLVLGGFVLCFASTRWRRCITPFSAGCARTATRACRSCSARSVAWGSPPDRPACGRARGARDPALGDPAQAGSTSVPRAAVRHERHRPRAARPARPAPRWACCWSCISGIVLALFVTLPYGKFVHGFYRTAALVVYERENDRH